ncbi:MAG TPA: HD domain-containing phosphohydrolase [Thermoanaerobaculia bacterium]|nr:HD domain-containing phosphohydrolase [Thermoanaerobaculia bacterium]
MHPTRMRGAMGAAASALAWSTAAAGEVVRAAPLESSAPFAAGLVGSLLALAAVFGIVRLLRRPAAPAAPPSTDAEAGIVQWARHLAERASRGLAPTEAALARMVAAAHARDQETLAHSFRVARYAAALARRLEIADDLVAAIEWGGLLHDVGKIAVPAEILRKAGPLTRREAAVMRRHPRYGYQLLRELVFLGPALDVVLSHHERWDGTGYPNRLAGESIPLAARVFAVADTYDAITSDRPYRPARTHAAAVAELRAAAGSQLDPRLVDAFLALPEAHLAALRDAATPEWEELDGVAEAGRAAAG